MRGATGVSSNQLIVPVAPGRATVGGATILAAGDDIVAQLDVAGVINLNSATVGVKIGGATSAYLRVYNSTGVDFLECVLTATDAEVRLTGCDALDFIGAVVEYSFDNIVNLKDNRLRRPRIIDFSMILQDIVATATTNIDYELGSYIRLDMNANITLLNLNLPPATGFFGALRLKITQSVGSKTITWPASVKWPGGVAPTLSTSAG
jgi:hypothetical protein